MVDYRDTCLCMIAVLQQRLDAGKWNVDYTCWETAQ